MQVSAPHSALEVELATRRDTPPQPRGRGSEAAVPKARGAGASPKKAAGARPGATAAAPAKPESTWTFLTNHAHVLLCIAREPEVRMRDVADLVGITERAVQRIVADLADAGYIERIRHGRRNHYEVRADLPLRHPIERHENVSALIALVHGKP